jgi:hypothetical protein
MITGQNRKQDALRERRNQLIQSLLPNTTIARAQWPLIQDLCADDPLRGVCLVTWVIALRQ